MELKSFSSSLQMGVYKLVCVFVLFGLACGNHPQRQVGGSVGFIEQSLSLDPFLLPPSRASSSASSSASATAGGASSMASSSAGGSSASSRSVAGRQRSPLRIGSFDIHVPSRTQRRFQDQLTLRARQRTPTRRRPVRLVIVRPDRRTGQTTNSHRIQELILRQRQRQQQQRGTSLPLGDILRPVQSRIGGLPTISQRIRQKPNQQPVVPLDEVLSVLRLLLGDLGASPATQPPLPPRLSDLFGIKHPVTNIPPGLKFLGNQPSIPIVEQVPGRTIINRLKLPTINSFPSASSMASSSAGSGLTSAASSSSGFVDPRSAASPASTSFLDANSLTIEGQTPSGDLIIGGPGGTITIGAEVLNGISRTGNASLVHTEFEEMEPEELLGKRPNPQRGLQVASKKGRPMVLTGKQTIVPKRRPASTIQVVGQNNLPLVGQSNLPLLVESHPPLASQGNQPLIIDSASILTSNNSGSGLKVAASGRSVSGEVSIAASSSSGSSGLHSNGQKGVSVTSGAQGKVIHLKGTDTIVVGGGSNGRIDVGTKVSGVKAPGNATFIVGG